MKNFLCGLSRDKHGLTNINFSAGVKNNIAFQELTFHITVPRLLYTEKNGYQQAISSPARLRNLFT
jgi:hypothetical protein